MLFEIYQVISISCFLIGETDSHYILISWDENTSSCILRYIKVHYFFLVFGKHPKVSNNLIKYLLLYKNKKKPWKIFWIHLSYLKWIRHLIDKPSSELNILAENSEIKDKPHHGWKAICISSSSLCLAHCLLFFVAQAWLYWDKNYNA